MQDEPSPPPVGTRRPGGRTGRTRAAVLSAVRTVLAEQGPGGLTIDAISKASGVNRSTIYRRWRDAPTLVADLAAEYSASFAVPATGSVAGDLRAMVDQLRERLDGDGARVVAALIGWQDPRVRAVLDEFWAARRSDTAAVLAAHGCAADARRITRLLAAPVYYQALIEGERPTDADLDTALSLVLSALDDSGVSVVRAPGALGGNG